MRSQVSDADPNRAWSNFEFISGGAISEVDVFLLTRKGAYLIEIKSTPGRLVGDQQRWTFYRPDGGRTTMENPLLGAERKAKRLKSLLEAKWASTKIDNASPNPPYIKSLVFLSDPNLQVDLPTDVKAFVHGRDGSPVVGEQRLSGIIEAIARLGADQVANPFFKQINTPTSNTVAKTLESIGIKESKRTRRVGQWLLKLDTVRERQGIQDFVADHEHQAGIQRRVRIYSLQPMMAVEQTAALRRAADREFLATERLAHPHIVRAVERFDTDLGAAVVFDYDPKAQGLDEWIDIDSTTLDDRLSVLRQLAETMHAMHRKKITHRALSPGSVLVRPGRDDEPRWVALVTDLSLAGRDHPESPGSTTTTRRTTNFHLPTAAPGDVDLLADEFALRYQAPESWTDDHPDGIALDVFSFGAIAFHVLAGLPPGDSNDAVRQQLLTSRGLQLSAAVPGIAESLHSLVLETTRPLVSERATSFDDVLAALDLVEEELTAPATTTTDAEPIVVDELDPLDAKVGEQLGDGSIVKKRLGRGSTAVALLVDRGESVNPREVVYKVALGSEAHPRLEDEARILKDLRHQFIVECYGTTQLKNRFVLIESFAGPSAAAGPKSLADELRRSGTPGVEFLQRWGEDLLDALTFLERKGRWHRDIKPDNLGVTEIGPNREQHLVLFDFSLATVPVTDLRAGTPPYLDPFLATRQQPQWDLAAERYAAAVTLYEMATGELPIWGDGQSDPAFTQGPVRLDELLFDPAVRDTLKQFFVAALDRDPGKRHGDAEAMLRDWRKVFTALDQHETGTTTPRPASADANDAEFVASTTLPDTLELGDPIVSVGAPPKVMSALARLGVGSVRQLADLVPIEVNRARRISPRVRRRIIELRATVLQRFADELAAANTKTTNAPSTNPSTNEVATELPYLDLDALVPLLLPAPPSRRSKQGSTQPAVRMLLGLDAVIGAESADWPSQGAIAKALGLTPGRIGQISPKARGEWSAIPALRSVRDELAGMLAANGGVAGVRELEPWLVESRGSGLTTSQAVLNARAVVRAAIGAEEYEASHNDATPRFTARRKADRVIVALEAPETIDSAAFSASALLNYAILLGETADAIVGAVADVVPQDRALPVLRQVSSPEGVALADGRLLRLAAAASQTVAVSTQLELYPLTLDAVRAVRLARQGLVGAQKLSIEEICERVQSRFADLLLPTRPELDRVLIAADIALDWNDTTQLFERKPTAVVPLSTITETFARHETRRAEPTSHRSRNAELDPEIELATEIEGRLLRSLQSGGFLALRVAISQRHALKRELSRFTGTPHSMTTIDLETEFLTALSAGAQARNVPWETLVRADAAVFGTTDYDNLRRFTATAAGKVENTVQSTAGAVIAWNAGALARYDEMGVIDRLRDAAGRVDTPLHTLWLVVFGSTTDPLPSVDGQPVRVMGRSQWLDIPTAWLENRHRAHSATGTDGATT